MDAGLSILSAVGVAAGAEWVSPKRRTKSSNINKLFASRKKRDLKFRAQASSKPAYMGCGASKADVPAPPARKAADSPAGEDATSDTAHPPSTANTRADAAIDGDEPCQNSHEGKAHNHSHVESHLDQGHSHECHSYAENTSCAQPDVFFGHAVLAARSTCKAEHDHSHSEAHDHSHSRSEAHDHSHAECLSSSCSMDGIAEAIAPDEASAAAEASVGAAEAHSQRAAAMLLINEGDLDGAEPLLRKALEGCRQTLGDRHPYTLTSIACLGGLLKDKGDLDGAEALLLEALAGKREVFGDRHPSTLASVAWTGQLLQDKGDLTRAEALLGEALQGCRETLGDRDPKTLTSINNLSALLYAKGDLDGAEPLLREVVAGFRDTLGDGHPSTLSFIYGLASLLQEQGKLGEAIPLFREELEGCAARYGEEHKETRGSARNLIDLLREAGRRERKAARFVEADALAAQYELE